MANVLPVTYYVVINTFITRYNPYKLSIPPSICGTVLQMGKKASEGCTDIE